MVDLNVNGKIAVITGGSRGLGLYCAEALLQNGAARVYISSRKAEACEDAVRHLNSLHGISGKAFAIPADVSTKAGNDHLVAQFTDKFGERKLDILIANAGASWGAPFGQHPDEAVGKVLDLNVRGVFGTIQGFGPHLFRAGKPEDPSRVLIMGSVAAFTIADAGTYGYMASKAAVTHMGRALAAELAPRNVTVNILAPGFFPSRMSNGLLAKYGDEMVKNNPRRRLGEPDDIKTVCVFLCSKQANYLNGVVLPIDGGASLVATVKI